jgi:hypothetical protein
MKYVLTDIDGVPQEPVPLDAWLDEQDLTVGYDAMYAWLHGRPFECGGGAAPHWVDVLIDKPDDAA